MGQNPTFSLSIMHDVRVKERRECLAQMRQVLGRAYPCILVDKQKPKGMLWEEFKTHLAFEGWSESLAADTSHCVFLTDDLHLAPRFWEIVRAMCTARPEAIWGLLSNHPRGPELWHEGYTAYRCNSWVVGPAYIMPRQHLEAFFRWWLALPDNAQPKGRRWFNDDSAINEWVTCGGGPGESYHPLPTCIEHRDDLASTVGHGDEFSKERVSWRAIYKPHSPHDGHWDRTPTEDMQEWMCNSDVWFGEAPMLSVGQ